MRLITITIALFFPAILLANTVTEKTEWHFNQGVPPGSGISDGDRAELVYCAKMTRELQDINGKLTNPTVTSSEGWFKVRHWREGTLDDLIWLSLSDWETPVNNSATIDFTVFPPEVGGNVMNLGRGAC